MSNLLNNIGLLEAKLEQIISNYEFLKEENEALFNNNLELQQLLKERNQEIEKKEEALKFLKYAKTIEGSKENGQETKKKINALIREIDKCITLLNS